MKKIFFILLSCFIANIAFTQTSFDNIITITPSSLSTIDANILQKNNTTCMLYGYDHKDYVCAKSMESECISYAIRNLAVSKFGSWEDAEYTPIFIENRYTATDNIELNLLSALNVAKTQGIPSISFEPFPEADLLINESDAIVDASWNTINYGKLQFANDTNLIKNTIDKGYPVIVYFQSCDDYKNTHIPEDYANSIWGESFTTNLNRTISDNPYKVAVIVGYELIDIPSRNRYEFCFTMYCPKELSDGYQMWVSNTIYVPFYKIAENIFDYAIVPHSLSPYKIPTTIEGPNYLSCTKNYQVSNLPPSATISWMAESLFLNISSGQNTPNITVTPTTTTLQPTTYANLPGFQVQTPRLIANININGQNIELTKDITIVESVAPTMKIKNVNTLFPKLSSGKTYTFQVTNAELSDNNSLIWDITQPNGVKQYKIGKEVDITPNSGGTLRISIENTDGCQPNNISSYSYSVLPFIIMQYNNPANETLNIQIVEQNENARTLSLEQNYYNGKYTIELYDENTTLVRKIECEENTPFLQIPISSLTPGYYYLRLIVNNQLIDVKQVIIN